MARTEEYVENRMFQTNQEKLFESAVVKMQRQLRTKKKKIEKGALKSEQLESSCARWTAFISCHE